MFIFLIARHDRRGAVQAGRARASRSIGTNPQGAFPVLVSNLLPVGLRGLVLAGMLSALMSALASLFNSTATLFTVDFYKRLRPQVDARSISCTSAAWRPCVVIVLGMVVDPDSCRIVGGQLYTLSATGAVAARARRSPRCSWLGIFSK